jgi:transcriptional regulator with XRE-family HTH domain
MKVNIEKIKSLAKEKGISISFICESVGMGRGYLNDIKKSNGGDIPDERLEIIVNILNTTVDYLADKTDIKEKPPEQTGDDELVAEFIELMESLSDDELLQTMNFIKFLKQQKQS